MGFHLFGRDVHVPAEIPKPGLVASTLLSMATIAVLAVCLSELPRCCTLESTLLTSELARRIQATRNWGRIPVTRWRKNIVCRWHYWQLNSPLVLFAIYVDSMVFIVVTSVLEHGFGLNLNQTICSSAILLCLVCYMTTKVSL
jgi:hypothetical protein